MDDWVKERSLKGKEVYFSLEVVEVNGRKIGERLHEILKDKLLILLERSSNVRISFSPYELLFTVAWLT